MVVNEDRHATEDGNNYQINCFNDEMTGKCRGVCDAEVGLPFRPLMALRLCRVSGVESPRGTYHTFPFIAKRQISRHLKKRFTR